MRSSRRTAWRLPRGRHCTAALGNTTTRTAWRLWRSRHCTAVLGNIATRTAWRLPRGRHCTAALGNTTTRTAWRLPRGRHCTAALGAEPTGRPVHTRLRRCPSRRHVCQPHTLRQRAARGAALACCNAGVNAACMLVQGTLVCCCLCNIPRTPKTPHFCMEP